jgi:hypothetical protein
MDGQIGTWTFPPSTSVPPVSTIPAVLHILIYMLFLSEGKIGVLWEPSKGYDISEMGENWIQKYFHFCFIYTICTAQFADSHCPFNVRHLTA